MNIYEVQEKNKRLTVLILLIFIGFFLIIGFGFDYFYLNQIKINSCSYTQRIEFIPIGTIASLIISLIFVLIAFTNGIKMLISSTGARVPDPNNLKERQLLNVVEEMALAAGIPRPLTYIVPDNDLNAFATGFSPEKSYIFVTQGLIDNLTREELQAVIGHEISHIRFYDIRLMTVVTVLINAIGIISDIISRSMRRGSTGYRSSSSRRNNSSGIIFLIWIIFVILAPIISRILAMAISRKREYLADAGSAELTRNPKALISALEKIRMAIQPTKSMKDSVAHLCITDPRGSLIEERTDFFSNLFATHPPMEKRILALKLMAYEYEKQTDTQNPSYK